MEKKLTNDADKLLGYMYKNYLERRKTGESRDNAIRMGDVEGIAQVAPKTKHEDIADLCRELDRAGYLQVYYADDTVYTSWLTPDAIIYLENRFKDGIKGVLGFLSQFIP